MVMKKGESMKIQERLSHALILMLALILFIPAGVFGQDAAKKTFSQEELDQMLAPIALYPDSLMAQVLMAATYPLEIVQADRFAKKNKDLKGDKLLEAAKNEDWDPTVKSLLQFPDVIAMMSEKLDWTTKMGDAFLAQQKDVMDSVQRLRKKAQEAGNLKTTKEQTVVVEKETIIIQSPSPQVIYVPTYNPTVVYGTWAYPAYPPYPYYPPGYGMAAATFGFMAGVAVGSSGCCWGNCNWGGGDIDIDVNRNNNFTKNNYSGDRVNHYQKQGGQGGRQQWQHNPENRKGAAYRDQGTAQKFNKGASSQAVKSREAYRGRAEQGRQDIARGGADQFKGGQAAGGRDVSGQKGSAFSGMDRGGSSTRDYSNRGSSSRQSMSSGGGGGGSRGGGGGGGGGSRGGGGGGRGGGGGGGRR
jgi:hypothetical protein